MFIDKSDWVAIGFVNIGSTSQGDCVTSKSSQGVKGKKSLVSVIKSILRYNVHLGWR